MAPYLLITLCGLIHVLSGRKINKWNVLGYTLMIYSPSVNWQIGWNMKGLLINAQTLKLPKSAHFIAASGRSGRSSLLPLLMLLVFVHIGSKSNIIGIWTVL
jgi:hypothetical protein